MSARILKDDWEFNILGAYNYRKPGPLQYYFDYIVENHDRIPGDLLEAGVFKGRALIGAALLLKELGSTKTIYGYDSWSGFPPIYHELDSPDRWEQMHAKGVISDQHLRKIRLNLEYRRFDLKKPAVQGVTAQNVSLSGDFSGCSKADVQAKLDFLGLDNVQLVEGPFSETMVGATAPMDSLMSVLIDADLYESYKVCLPFVWGRLSRGGYIFLDEYYSLKFPGARVATDEFFADKQDKPQCHKLIEGDFERWYVRKLFE